MDNYISIINFRGDSIFNIILLVLVAVFGIAAFSLERELAIISFLVSGLFLSMIFIQLNAFLLGIFQLSIFAGLALVLLFYQRAKILHETRKHKPKIAALLSALFLVFLVQFSIVQAKIIPASSIWTLRPSDVILLAVFSFSVAVGLAALKRWKSVR